MKKELFKGCATALITPFDHDGRIDFDCFEAQIEYQIASGADALVVAGTTGEGSVLSDDEFLALLNFAIFRVKERVPVIAGTGKNDTGHALGMSVAAYELGADGLLIVTPYYNKTSQKGLIKHFTYIADRAKLPVIIYNVPSRTGLSCTAQTYRELSSHPRIIGVKEASSDITLPLETRRICPEDFYIYSGNDDMTLPFLSLGASGVISVLSNIAPKAVHDMCQAYFDGHAAEALSIQLKYGELTKALFEDVNPIPLKCAMKLLGKDSGYLRMPLCECSEILSHRLRNILCEMGYAI
ncbi:MAG: 4-hydroxy-tetrahydrodipicolinate synthase [Clostridiaceae bacterium]|nr:4-hydroxy-tetrahydrodipicolinate synthase [Clostridiaceae bacterium]